MAISSVACSRPSRASSCPSAAAPHQPPHARRRTSPRCCRCSARLASCKAGDPKGETTTAWHAKEAVRELYAPSPRPFPKGQISVDNLIAAIAAKNGPVDLAGYFRQYAGPDHPHEGRMLLLSPAHATPIADGGFDKAQLRARLRDEMATSVRQLREPLRKLAEQGNVRAEYRDLFELSDAEASELIYPMIEEVTDMRVVVCGSIRGKNAMFPTTGGAVTIPIPIPISITGTDD